MTRWSGSIVIGQQSTQYEEFGGSLLHGMGISELSIFMPFVTFPTPHNVRCHVFAKVAYMWRSTSMWHSNRLFAFPLAVDSTQHGILIKLLWLLQQLPASATDVLETLLVTASEGGSTMTLLPAALVASALSPGTVRTT